MPGKSDGTHTRFCRGISDGYSEGLRPGPGYRYGSLLPPSAPI